MIIERDISSICKEIFGKYPVLTITGPRQSGKTTLAKRLFPEKRYVNLEDPDTRMLALNDPRSFLSNFPDGAIIDEIQRVPDITSYLQTIVDGKRNNSMFVLTGSQQFEISQSISQSLAGRSAVIKLLPLSLKELQNSFPQVDLDNLLLQGFYPGRYANDIPPHIFYRSYLETYVERDLRQLSQIENLPIFEKFMRLLAGRVGQLLNFSSLANDLGVSHTTIKKWVNLLEAGDVVCMLQPFYRNIGKRLIKMPKIYFYDTGLAAYLLGVENAQQLKLHPLRGNIFENFVIVEFLKSRYNQAKSSNIFFYRDRTGNEVDIVAENPLSLMPVEVKSAETITKDFVKGIKHFKNLFKDESANGVVIYAGNESSYSYGEYSYISWKDLPSFLKSGTL